MTHETSLKDVFAKAKDDVVLFALLTSLPFLNEDQANF